jgi:HEAT repeat protein
VEGVVLALLKTLETEQNRFVREEIMRGLGRIGTKEAVAALAGGLTDHKADVRREAAVALQGLGPAAREAIPALQALLASETDAEVRGPAEVALRRMTGGTDDQPSGLQLL